MNVWYRLHGARSSIVIKSCQHGLPEVVYWGKTLKSVSDDELAGLTDAVLTAGYLDQFPVLSIIPELGAGFHGEAGLEGHRQRQHWAPRFQVTAVETSDRELVFDARDEVAQLMLTIKVTMDTETDVVGFRSSLTNTADSEFLLHRLGNTVSLPAYADELLTFHGHWAREFVTGRQRWPANRVVKENRKGRTSSDAFPGIVAGTPGFSEQSGEVYGLHLAASGNHRLVAEKAVQGGRYIQAGEWLYPGEVALAKDESYSTPWLYGSWSGDGLSQMSLQFHRFLKKRLRLDVATQPRKVHFNSWEALYFSHEPKALLKLVDQAAAIGVERFILDDGWFRGRNDDTAGLGDWYVDERKHPGGLQYLIDAVNQKGMEFGLWFEPEMVNPDSDLYRAHPDWVLKLDGYDQVLGRNQMVLDLSRPEVFDYLYERIDSLLSQYRIDYIKWDMNRDLVQPGSAGVASVHRQVEALYRLMASINDAHPTVEIESCSSGGARIDFEILRYTQRVWASDCIDPVERQRLQQAYSIFFSNEIMGSHVSVEKAHTTGRSTNLMFRLMTSLYGHMGLELALDSLSADDETTVRQLLKYYKDNRTFFHTGDWIRVDTPESYLLCNGVVSTDKRRASFTIAALDRCDYLMPGRLRLTGLDPEKRYSLTAIHDPYAHHGQLRPNRTLAADAGIYSGDALMKIGIQLPVIDVASAIIYDLNVVE
ncbi:alpha-galactosidase [Gynuella sp.]|uniref:alpha-galactosidase n=1 Tax=Gynuella sp. TaxID=2969146 RepID=UPI003D0F09EB